MNIFKFLFGSKSTKLWLIISSLIIVLFLTISIAMNTFLYEVLCSVVGGKRAIYADGVVPIYTSDYATKSKTLEVANALNEKLCEEGFVLLKNKDSALPIYTPSSELNNSSSKPMVSIFGKNSVNIAYGGTGSGGSIGGDVSDIYLSLSEAGYETNPTLKSFYENMSQSGTNRPEKPEGSNLDNGDTVSVGTYETPQSSYTDAVKSSYAVYRDAAIVVFTRMGGEGFDLPRNMKGVSGAESESDHYLQLDKNEKELLAAIIDSSAGFKKVVVVLNVGTSMEIGDLENNDGVGAVIWMGFPGDSGTMALGRILNGNVNPSGRTVDTFAANFKEDPTFANFADNNIAGGDSYILDGVNQANYYVDYEENIYVGYRYYETRGAQDAEWYKENVVYPFGFGLSYTNFTWEMEDESQIAGKVIVKDEAYTVKVKVTNNGGVAGKDIVQLYGHAPYYAYEIEKPEFVLLDFKKTGIIMPGEHEIIELTLDPYYLASYDYKDSNNNGFYGFELDVGNYELYISKNAHDKKFTVPFTVTRDIIFSNDPVSGNSVANRYTNNEDAYFDSDNQLDSDKLLTRINLTQTDWSGMPETRTELERTIDRDFLAMLNDMSHNNTTDFGAMQMPVFEQDSNIVLRDMLTDEHANFGKAAYADGRWEVLLNQTKISELLNMVNFGAFKSAEIDSIGKPLTNDTDGPAGFVNFMLQDGTYYGTCYYACQMVVASTWSQELAGQFGEMVGNEGIWGADGKGNGMPYSGWYAPGANIHRSPFGGRNFEYMSEDGVLTGKMAAAQIRGAQSRGVYCFMKHFAVNDQETHRSNNGISVWLTEQSMREIYLRPFEIAVKQGGTRALMSSFNRIGTRWAGGDYRLLTQILREEWGFRGIVISDFTSGSYMNPKQMAYAGGDLNLNNQKQYEWKNFDSSSVADVTILRQCAQNIFYTVTNSNVMNGDIIGYRLPYWQIWLIVSGCVVGGGIIAWGFFAFRNNLKKQKSTDKN